MVQAPMVKGESHAIGGPGRFVLGRSELMAERLLSEYCGKVKLIYLDPPFGTGDTFSLKLSANKKRITQPVYSDALSRQEHLAMMRVVLEACHGMLADDGSIYLHMDHRLGAQIRLMMDEIFGENNFMNEIVWSYRSGGRSLKHYSRKHDTILFYRKGPSVYFDIAAVGVPRGPKKRNNMKRSVDPDGRVFFSIRSGGKIYTYYEDTPIYPSDVWDDIEHLHQRDPERTGYATQKPEALLRRVISASSKPGDLVADLFSGSGTTAAVASAMGRRFLAVDASPIALYTLRKRQLTAHASTRMFLDASRMDIEYGVAHALGQAPRTELVIQDRSGAAEIEIGAYRGPTALAYLAAGRVEDGIFNPSAYELNPVSGMRLRVADGDGIVIQECDFDGSQVFYAL